MKLILASGVIAKARRYMSAASSVQEEEVKDPSKLAEIIRQSQKRISDLEARSTPESFEFECNVGSGGSTTTIAHGIKGPVRWWVTSWLQQSGVGYPVLGPALVQDASTVTGRLVLRSYVTGRALVRVEPAQVDVDPGITVTPVADVSEYNIVLGAAATTGTLTATATNLTFPVKSGETWDVKVCGTAMSANTSGMNYSVLAPVASTIDGVINTSSINQAAANLLKLGFVTINSLVGPCHAGATAALRNDEIFFRVKAGADGNITIAIASNTLAFTTTLGAMTSLLAKRVTQV